MPDLCFYAPWIMKEPIPDPFRMMLEKAGKKRISYDEADCSMRNIRKQGKVSRLHGPTLHALLTLIQIRKEKDSGAAGIQRGRDAINYFCMYQSRSVFIRHRIRYWNLIAFCGWQNQRISGIFTKTLPAIIPGSGLLWLTTAKKTASAFMQI